MRVSPCAPVMLSVPSSTKHGRRRRRAAARVTPQRMQARGWNGLRCVCLLRACVLHGQRCGTVIGPGARNRRGPRPLEGCSTTCSLLHRAYIVLEYGAAAAQKRAQRVRCRVQQCSSAAVQQCSDCSHCSSTSSVGRQAGRRWDGQGDRAAPCHRDLALPSRRNVNLNHAAHGTRHTARYSVRLDKVPGSVDGQVLAPPSSTEYTVLCSARSDRTCVDSVSEQKGWCPRVTRAALRCAIQ